MPKGGVRKGAGRKARPAPKSKGIWCGQITDEQRDFIMQWLSPEDRYSVLVAAANTACSRPPIGVGQLSQNPLQASLFAEESSATFGGG